MAKPFLYDYQMKGGDELWIKKFGSQLKDFMDMR